MKNVQINIKGNRCYIYTELDVTTISLLDLELSYMPLGYDHSPAFKRGVWDGRINLLGRDLTFSIGLLERVINFFENKEYEVVINNYNKYTDIKSIDIVDKLNALGLSPRYYQLDAAKIAVNNKMGIIRIATGGGKTLVASLIIGLIGKSAVIYVIGKDLLWQFHKFLSKVFEQEIGIIGDGIVNIKQITVASIWTVGQAFGMKKRSEEEKDNEKTVSSKHYDEIKHLVAYTDISIMDECHLGAAETMQRIGSAMRSEYRLGMSA